MAEIDANACGMAKLSFIEFILFHFQNMMIGTGEVVVVVEDTEVEIGSGGKDKDEDLSLFEERVRSFVVNI